MKKILIVSHEFPPKTGGAGSFAIDLANGLSQQSNFDVTVITTRNKKRKKANYSFKFLEALAIPKLGFWSIWMKMKQLELYDYDTIILNDIGAGQVGTFFFFDILIGKSICMLHGSEPEKIYEEKNFLFKLINYSFSFTELLKKCSKIIAVSKDMKSKFIEMSSLGELNNKVFIINNGIDLNKFYPNKIDLYSRYSIPKDNKLILTVSRVTKLKGFDNKLKILESLNKCYKEFTWIIVGDGDYFKSFEKKVKKSAISTKVIFVGKVRRDLLKEYYSSVDLFFLLSEYRESFGLVYLEANACGCPVIANNYGGVKEIIIDGINGYCIDKSRHQLIIEKIKEIFFANNFDRQQILKYAYTKRLSHTIGELIKII